MMADGAHLNMGAESAMKAIVGGKEPESMTEEGCEKMIRTAPKGGDGFE